MSYSPSTDYKYNAALGKVAGATVWNKWGYNADIDTAAQETIWSPGGLLTYMTSADTLDIVSSDVNDTSAGTGARSIIIYGVDENRASQIEVVTLNGTTPVTTTNQWLGVNRMSIYLAGSSAANEGDITASATTAATTQAEIPATQGSTQHAFFFTQAGHTALADWLWLNINKISGGGSPRVTIQAWVTSLVSGAQYEVFEATIDTSVENTVELRPSQPFVIGEKSLFELRASTDTNNTVVNARFSLIEVQTS